jgi:hypothetical protein
VTRFFFGHFDLILGICEDFLEMANLVYNIRIKPPPVTGSCARSFGVSLPRRASTAACFTQFANRASSSSPSSRVSSSACLLPCCYRGERSVAPPHHGESSTRRAGSRGDPRQNPSLSPGVTLTCRRLGGSGGSCHTSQTDRSSTGVAFLWRACRRQF